MPVVAACQTDGRGRQAAPRRSGASDEITPIVKIDGRVIGDSRPGPITRRLVEAFRVAPRG